MIKGVCGHCKHIDIYDMDEQAECSKCGNEDQMWIIWEPKGDLENE
jgi:hypothetical protein